MAIKTVWPDDSQILNSIHKGEHFLLAKTLGKSLFHLQTDWLGNDLASQFWQMESPLSYILYALNHVRFPSHCKWYSLVTGFTILQLKIPCVAGGIVYLYAWEFWLRSRHLIKNEHQRRQKITKHLVPILCGLATPMPQCALWQSCQLCKLSLKSSSWYNFFHWVSESFSLIFAWNLCLENNGLLFIHVQWNLECYIYSS